MRRIITMFKFLPLGGVSEIGASCFYLNIDGTGILLDCGMHPQKTGLDALPAFKFIKDLSVDFVLISHAHQDHLSALPFLVEKHPYIRIITTPQTRALAEITLHNSVSILKEQVESPLHIPQKGSEKTFKIYSHDEIDLLIQSIEYKSYNEEFYICGYDHKSSEQIKVIFLDAGHILGSAGVLIEYKDHKIFYTGDINLSNQEIMQGAILPKTTIDTLIVETTYGSSDSFSLRSWKDEKERFSNEANKILNIGGSILLPVFSLGKTQELLAVIRDLMCKGKLIETDIYSGGLGRKISKVYDYNRFVVNYSDTELELSAIPQKNIYEVSDTNTFFKVPSFVLAPSGMMINKTISYQLGKKWLNNKNSAIFTVGYMEEKTPGFKFANAGTGDKISFYEYEKPIEVKCAIKNFRFGAHSKREELLEIFQKLNPKNVILVHGDLSSINWVGENILKINKIAKVYSPQFGKEIIIS